MNVILAFPSNAAGGHEISASQIEHLAVILEGLWRSSADLDVDEWPKDRA